MEHLQHFGLAHDPFQNEPDLRFYFDSHSHSAVHCRLDRALRQVKGLSVLSGDGGTGKTLLARRIFETLEEEIFEAQLLVMMAGAADATTVLRRYARQLGVEELADDRSQLLAQIYEKVAIVREEGRHTLLILDDAHVLSAAALAELGGLLNLEYEERRLISILLVGRPELDLTLSEASLDERVDARAPLSALDLANTAAYLSHRIREVGGNPIIIPPEAVDVLHKVSGGRPRLLNTLADNALFEAFLAGRQQIHPGDVERAAADLGLLEGTGLAPAPPMRPLPTQVAPAATVAAPPAPAATVPSRPVAPTPAPVAVPAAAIAPAAAAPLPAPVPMTAANAPAIQVIEPVEVMESVEPAAAQPVAEAPRPVAAMPPAVAPTPAQAASPQPLPPIHNPVAGPSAEAMVGEYTDPGAGPALTTAPPAAIDDLGDLLDVGASDDLAQVLGTDALEFDGSEQPLIELDAELASPRPVVTAPPAQPRQTPAAPQAPPPPATGIPMAEATRVELGPADLTEAGSTTADEIDDLFVDLVDD